MHRRQPLPRLWLMTDERQGDALWRALDRLPRGAGIVFRHHGLPKAERRRMFERVRRIARAKRMLLLLAGSPQTARAWRADGSHGWRPARGLASASVHNLREMRRAERIGATLLFVSPVFVTRSHPGAAPLGRIGFGRMAGQTRLPAIALGGMNEARGRLLMDSGAYGWAAIDAWSV